MEDYGWANRYLTAGEVVEWEGRPLPGALVGPGDAFAIPFSILWCAFAVFWTVSAYRGMGNPLFALWGLPFVVVGLYVVFGRFLVESRRRQNTRYAITNRRVLFWQNGRLDMLERDSLPALHLRPGREGAGTILFGEPVYRGYGRRHSGVPVYLYQLKNIPEAERVWALLSERG